MARSKSFTITVVDAKKTSERYDEVSRRLRNAKPAFSDVLDILEEGEKRHFARLRGRYVRSGRLMASLTQPAANDAIREAHGDGLVFGTSVYYAQFQTASRKSRETGLVTKQKGKSAVLVLQPKAKKAASRAILDFALEPFDDVAGQMVCAVAGCDDPAKAAGYCWMHYGRFRRNGDPLASGQHGGHNKGIARPAEANVPDPAPLQAVRLALGASRAAGVPFARAWREATAAVPGEWVEAMGATRTAWRSAYLQAGDAVFPLGALCLEPEARKIRRSGPPVVVYGARHDGPCSLEPLVDVPWCN